MTDKSKAFIEQIKTARDERYTLNIQGGNTKTFLGRKTDGSNHVLDTTNHSGVLTYEPVELVMQARAGTPIIDIENALSEHGQCLSSEPGSFNGRATIGGTLACNLSGPSRPFAGSFRDHVLGVSLINGLGQHLKFGGQVMKNVAGYDVSRLQAGSMGVFGLMTDISFKVMPKWRFDQSREHICDMNEGLDLCNQIANSERPLTGASWFDGALYLRFATMEPAIQKAIGTCSGNKMTDHQADSFWASLRNFDHTYFDLKTDELILRISIASSAPHPINISGNWAFDWAGSLRWLKVKKQEFELEPLKEWIARYDGSFYKWSGDEHSIERCCDLSEPIKKININLKKAFDPDAIFNPGRLYSWM